MTDDLPRTLKSCPVTTIEVTDPDRNILIVPDTSRDRLTDKEFVDYHEYRKQFLIYLLKFGKDESKALGYNWSTERLQNAVRMDLSTLLSSPRRTSNPIGRGNSSLTNRPPSTSNLNPPRRFPIRALYLVRSRSTSSLVQSPIRLFEKQTRRVVSREQVRP